MRHELHVHTGWAKWQNKLLLLLSWLLKMQASSLVLQSMWMVVTWRYRCGAILPVILSRTSLQIAKAEATDCNDVFMAKQSSQ